eukprot:TRINITY_DN67011_c3_g4_i6.p1 TRINITY_DN67011_c3_g4~~TRINITY_DN67011_c3_g4_i6.p1  ORF type:complete len:493 (-),score=33.39 TRINITY_DN67011_c3_g4_i6:81-1559(-)
MSEPALVPISEQCPVVPYGEVRSTFESFLAELQRIQATAQASLNEFIAFSAGESQLGCCPEVARDDKLDCCPDAARDNQLGCCPSYKPVVRLPSRVEQPDTEQELPCAIPRPISTSVDATNSNVSVDTPTSTTTTTGSSCWTLPTSHSSPRSTVASLSAASVMSHNVAGPCGFCGIFDHIPQAATDNTQLYDVDNSEPESLPGEQQINLNVGGQRFSTMRSTLCSEKDSFFDAMLHSGAWKPQGDPQSGVAEYFIDRSPIAFEYILTYLRTETEPVVALMTETEKEALAQDIDFYQISSLYHLIRDPPPEDRSTLSPQFPTVHFYDSDAEPPKVLISHSINSSTLHVKHHYNHFFRTTFPNHNTVPVGSTLKWAFTCTKTNNGRWPHCYVGIGDWADPHHQNSVYISFNQNTVRDHKASGQPFPQWPTNAAGTTRTVEFEYDPATRLIFIHKADGTKIAFKLVKAKKSIAPWCQPTQYGGRDYTVTVAITKL